MKEDKRKIRTVTPPDGKRRSYTGTVNLLPDDYMRFYMLSVHYDLNGTELIRKLIREEFNRCEAEMKEGGLPDA